MTDILTQPTPRSEAEMEEFLDQLLAEMQRLNEQMQRDQGDIDRLKAETEIYKVCSAEYKLEADKLQAEGMLLDTQNRSALDRLKVMVEAC